MVRTWKLGKLQRAMLEYLQKAGRPCYSEDIAWKLHKAGRDEHELGEPPSRSFRVSVRHAIHTLTDRGLIHCGYVRERFGRGRRLMCWLPEHSAPRQLQTTMRGNEVERVILSVLRTADEEEIQRYLAEGVNVPMAERRILRHPGDIPYSYLTKRVRERVGNEPWVGSAISRAIRRLFTRRTVDGDYYGPTEWNSKSRVYMVRLSENVVL